MFQINQIRTTISIILIIIVILTTVISYINYVLQKRNYNEFIDYSVTNAVNNVKMQVTNAEEISYDLIHNKYAIFKKIHKKSITLLQENKELTLKELKQRIENKFQHESLFVDLYLINSKYIIYKTTNPKDLHLNMSNFMGAKEYLNEALKSNKIVISQNASYDILNKEYRVYSYATLDKEKKIILEIGFFDKLFSQIKNKMYKLSFKSPLIDKIELYSNYGKYIINLTNYEKITNIDKQDFLINTINSRDKTISLIKKVSKDKKNHSYEIEEDGKKYIIFYTHILDMNISKTQVKSYILKTKLNITKFKNKLQDLEYFFYFTLFASILFISIFFIFLNHSLIKPFKNILHHMQSWKKIENKNILNKNNELSQLALVFNQTYEKQIELNNMLQDKIKLAVQEDKKKLELLQKQSKLVQMGEMLAMIAHQWRQPLGSIGSAITTLQLQLKSKRVNFDNEISRKEYFEYITEKYTTINEYVQFLSNTIDDFKSFYKPDNEKEHIDITVPIKKALQILETSMKKNKITIKTYFHTDEKIFMYKNEMIQVLLNILKNSEDNFIEKQITNPCIIIETKKENGFVIIDIMDNGNGIPSEFFANIFDPYFSTKNDKNGTGLGLYMSKVIIEEHHNGVLQVENKNQGVSFSILLKNLNL